MKGTEVPNPRRISACDCTCVLTRIDHCLVTLSCLPCTLFCSCLCKIRSQISYALSQALCNLSFSSWFHTIWFYCFLSPSSFTLRAHLCCMEAYLLPMVNNRTSNERPGSPPLAAWSRFIRMCVFCGVKKWPTYRVAVSRTNRKRSSFATKNFQKFSTFFRPQG